ncbi:hypothetical protein [Crocosphaera watsonii]|uniref:Signal transduction histidine kinase n=1 Tax=Crocosphaera watsonii WH 0401 TaxID=555881 RepID=T2J4J9_CROWT|nr:hypothetical protein [Crocosphaera watsonii]CCQ60155.1 Signal transduction histidine kinase [Crocosphaera watsonii WH 0401]
MNEIVKVGQLLKLKSLADWQKLVSRYSLLTGERILAKFHTDKNHFIQGIYYVLPERKVEVDNDAPSPLDEGIIHLARQSQLKGEDGKGFNLDDLNWGINLSLKIEQGYKMSPEEAIFTHSRIAKYRGQLAKGDLYLGPIESIIHHYDPTMAPMVAVEGAALDAPLDHPKHLLSALQQAPEPLESSRLLLLSGVLLEKIAQKFRSSNAELDGFDVIQAGTAIVGAGFVALGQLREGFRRMEAQKLLRDPQLGDHAGQIEDIAQELDIQFISARDVLSARGDSITFIAEPNLGDDPQLRLRQWIELVDSYQRSLIEAIDDTRQVKPIGLIGGYDFADDIQRCQENQKQVNTLVTQTVEREKPLKILGGAISPEEFYHNCQKFFQARETANDRKFYPNLNYEVRNNNGLKLSWDYRNIRVTDNGKLILSIDNIDNRGGYQVTDNSDLTTITYLSSLPTLPEEIKQLDNQNKLFNSLKAHPYYSSQAGTIQVVGLGNFNFQPSPNTSNGCLIRGISAHNNEEFWRSEQRVEKNTLPSKLSNQIADKLFRPMRSQSTSHNSTRTVQSTPKSASHAVV